MELDRKTRAVLEEREKRFASEHRETSDEELLELVRAAAAELERSPQQNEMTGGSYIASRFRGWSSALKAAGLEPCKKKAPRVTELPAYKKEYKRQAALRRQELAAKKEEEQKKQLRKEEARQALQDRDAAWGRAHESDSDEALLAYVRSCAEELGRTPYRGDVTGGIYIKDRFGTWPLVLVLAGLELPYGMKPPKQAELDEYRHRAKLTE